MIVLTLIRLALAMIARGNAQRFHGESTLHPPATGQAGGRGAAPSGGGGWRTGSPQGAARGRTRAQRFPRPDAATGHGDGTAATHPPGGMARRGTRGAMHECRDAPTRMQSKRDASGTRTPENGHAQRATKADFPGKRTAFSRGICDAPIGNGRAENGQARSCREGAAGMWSRFRRKLVHMQGQLGGKFQRGGATGVWSRFRRKLVHTEGVSRSVGNCRTRRAVHRLGLWTGQLSMRGCAAITLLPILSACSMPPIERDDVTQRWRDREAAIWAQGFSYDRR